MNKIYLVEICLPTNNPGKWCHRRVFTNKEEAEEFVKQQTAGFEEETKELESNEWDDRGDNWHNILMLECADDLITLDEIDNEEKEEES